MAIRGISNSSLYGCLLQSRNAACIQFFKEAAPLLAIAATDGETDLTVSGLCSGWSWPAGQVIESYDYINASSIALPDAVHQGIPNLKGTCNGTPQELIQRDIENLRKWSRSERTDHCAHGSRQFTFPGILGVGIGEGGYVNAFQSGMASEGGIGEGGAPHE